MGILDKLDLPIIPEDLFKLGFIPHIYCQGLVAGRYNLYAMSNAEKADMINENLIYKYSIQGYYNIVITYYPSEFSYRLYKSPGSNFSAVIDLRSKTQILNDKIRGVHPYNLSILCETPCAQYANTVDQYIYVDNLRDLEEYVKLAKIYSEQPRREY